MRHSVLSCECTSRRVISRSVSVSERGWVSESGAVIRFAQVVTETGTGAVWPTGRRTRAHRTSRVGTGQRPGRHSRCRPWPRPEQFAGFADLVGSGGRRRPALAGPLDGLAHPIPWLRIVFALPSEPGGTRRPPRGRWALSRWAVSQRRAPLPPCHTGDRGRFTARFRYGVRQNRRRGLHLLRAPHHRRRGADGRPRPRTVLSLLRVPGARWRRCG